MTVIEALIKLCCEEMEAVEPCEAALCALVDALPSHHSSTLQHLMAHFCRMCRMHEEYGHREPADRLCHVFCHVLLRPPWENIAYVHLYFLRRGLYACLSSVILNTLNVLMDFEIVFA